MANPHIDTYLNSIDVAGVRELRTATSIFFCGGPRNTDKNGPCLSARDFVLRVTAAKNTSLFSRFFYEEQMKEWLNGGHFSDLHNLERHISEICSVVFLIAESPGSYAELGAFVSYETIIEKMFVVTNISVDDDKSYISLGPLSYLKKLGENKLRTYEWETNFATDKTDSIKAVSVNEDQLRGIVEDIIASLLAFEEANRSERSFDPDNDGHVSFLILDVIDVYGACQLNEIVEAISLVATPATPTIVRKHLFLLEQLDLIRKLKRGATYFVSTAERPYLSYAFKEDTPRDTKDRVRLKMASREWFRENDENRFSVIRLHVGGDDG